MFIINYLIKDYTYLRMLVFLLINIVIGKVTLFYVCIVRGDRGE